MVNRSSESHEQLADWLHRLVEILRTQGGSTWRSLVLITSGKTAAIEVDGNRLRVHADGGDQLQLEIEYILESYPVNFSAEAETLRDVINGCLTLDGAVANGKIYVRGDLDDLLGIHDLAKKILADSAVNPQLQRLWEEFDNLWSRPLSPPPCQSLEQQIPYYGYLINNVPEDVLDIEVN